MKGGEKVTIKEISDSVIKFFAESPIFKGIFSFVGWLLMKMFGAPDAALQAFLALLLFDLVTGLLKAEVRGEAKSFISHEKGRKKYISYAVVLFIAQMLDTAMIPGIRNIALFWGSATEARSIIENLEAMGCPMPDFIKQHINKTGEKYKF